MAVFYVFWLSGLSTVKSIFLWRLSGCGVVIAPVTWRSFCHRGIDVSLLVFHGWIWILFMDFGLIWTTQKFHRILCVWIQYVWIETKADDKYLCLMLRSKAACTFYSDFVYWTYSWEKWIFFNCEMTGNQVHNLAEFEFILQSRVSVLLPKNCILIYWSYTFLSLGLS